ncbi:MAG: flagellar biosynthetic protein FliR [Lachnospiraceae bacterium]|nr:flagellar biosynthetic protein FliR [Lachnospiraceae bacterium]
MKESIFTLQQLEFFLVLFIRITGFVYTAPFFSLKNSPRSVKVGFSLLLSLIIFNIMPYEPLEYGTVVGYAVIIAKNLLAGLLLGFLANVCYQIISLAGHLIDMEIGFSMVNEFDPVTSTQVTVSGTFYEYGVMLVLMVTYLHHYLLDALIDSFKLVPVGDITFNPLIYNVGLKYIVDFFVLAFRIVLPVFGALLIVNAILAIMAKVAPQMNMFVIGMQLKVLVGLVVMLIVIELLPGVAEFIFDEMFELMRMAMSYMEPG